MASKMKRKFTICGRMEVEKASQIVYHSIFGTFKEDLSILAQITGVSLWYTREQLGTCFRQQGSSEAMTRIEFPEMKYYAKMSCANQIVVGVQTVGCYQESIVR